MPSCYAPRRMHNDDTLLNLVPEWRPGPERHIASTRILEVRAKQWTSPSNPARAGEFVYFDAPAWVNVIALTPRREVVLIEQFRHALGKVTLELPGGMVDPGEPPETAIVRELAEETGYAGAWRGIIGSASANPALLNNWCHTGLVTDAERTADLRLDENEEIAVRLVPLARIPDLIRSGLIHHSLVIAAFHYLSLSPWAADERR